MKESQVDVVVVSYNSKDRLRDCVEPLSTDPSIEVFIVDNASIDGTLSAVADLPVSTIESKTNIGFGSGCNLGWRAGSSTHVLFLNPDARVSLQDVLRLSQILEMSGAAAIAPRMTDDSGALAYSLRRFPEVRSIFGQAMMAHRVWPNARWVDEVIRDPQHYESQTSCDWASGACLMVTRRALERVRGFDEGFFMYCEDVDLCRRLWDDGGKVVYTPAVVCTHAGGASAPRWRLVETLARSRIRYASKHFGRGRAAAYRVGVGLNAFTHILVGEGVNMRLGHAQALGSTFRNVEET